MSRHKINELLSERHQRFTPLQRLLRHATSQEQWTAQLRAILPQSIARDCQISDVRPDAIVVSCRNASAATKVRFMAPEILDQLTNLAAFQGARELKVQVSRSP